MWCTYTIKSTNVDSYFLNKNSIYIQLLNCYNAFYKNNIFELLNLIQFSVRFKITRYPYLRKMKSIAWK